MDHSEDFAESEGLTTDTVAIVEDTQQIWHINSAKQNTATEKYASYEVIGGKSHVVQIDSGAECNVIN